MAVVISGNVIDMGDKPISNVSIVNSASVVDKAYVDDLKTIATGTATFTATTNNINLTGIGIGVEIGDVIQISGADDTKNNSEFTIEVITDANNVIVNQAHANKGTTKNVANRASDAGVTVKLLAKWYNAPIGLGQGWVNVISSRSSGTNYQNLTNREFVISIGGTLRFDTTVGEIAIFENSVKVERFSMPGGNASFEAYGSVNSLISKGSIYTAISTHSQFANWFEKR